MTHTEHRTFESFTARDLDNTATYAADSYEIERARFTRPGSNLPMYVALTMLHELALEMNVRLDFHTEALEIARCVADAHALVAEHGYNVGLGLAHKRYGTEAYHEAYGIWEGEDERRSDQS
ncbi:hypothetical protein [Amycolatopsis sp. NPDC001319]|uniref:hypothetical protein n=1 Tax=unclassified Amycolatopsis TaxID=2618356 RepID=UPI0036A1A0DE